MGSDPIGNPTTGSVFKSVNTRKVQKASDVKRDEKEPGSDDSTNEQHKDSEKKRHRKPEYPTYGSDGKIHQPPPSELDVEG